MASSKIFSPWRILRYIIIAFMVIVLFVSFLIWRTDNPRIEALRFTIMDRYTPNMDWLYSPLRNVSGLVTNFQSYEQLRRENRELRQQVQQMEVWREAARQLEQINAELRALNKLSLKPELGYVTGEIIGDSGTPFSQTALINIGANKGVEVGAPAVDATGLIGRVIGVGKDKSRILMLSDPSSQVSARIMPQGLRAIVRGNNGPYLDLIAIDGGADALAGARVVTSGSGIYPDDLLIGYLAVNVDENDKKSTSVRIAANFGGLELARILLPSETPEVKSDLDFIGSAPESQEPLQKDEAEDGAEAEGETREASEAAGESADNNTEEASEAAQ